MTRTARTIAFTIALLGVLAVARPATAQDDRHGEYMERMHEALRGLEHSLHMLEDTGHDEIMMVLRDAANALGDRIECANDEHRERIDHDERERDAEHRERTRVAEQAEVLRTALRAFREVERGELAQATERAIQLREFMLEGREDGIRRLRAIAPGPEDTRHLVNMSIDLYREFGKHDIANRMRRAAEELWSHPEERGHERRRDHIRHELEILRLAMPALREKGQRDVAEVLEHAIHAREWMIENPDAEEARDVIRTAPSVAEVVEILRDAAKLWNEFGHETKARQIAEHAERMWDEFNEARERKHEQHEDAHDEDEREHDDERLERLERQLEEIHDVLRMMREELHDLRKDRDR